jgi:hypothetical protein
VCHDCGHWAAEPEIRAWCGACNTYYEPGGLMPLHIKRYDLSENGIHVARAGSWDPNAAPAAIGHESPMKDDIAGADMDMGYAKDLTRLLINVAANNQSPMTVYRIDLAAKDADDPELVEKTEKLLRRTVRNHDLVARIDTRTFLMVLPSKGKHEPSVDQIEKYVSKKLDIDLTVSVLDPDNAADLLAEA